MKRAALPASLWALLAGMLFSFGAGAEEHIRYQDEGGKLIQIYQEEPPQCLYVWQPKQGKREIVHDFSQEYGGAPGGFYREGDQMAGITCAPTGGTTYHLFTRDAEGWKEVIRSPLGSTNTFKRLKYISPRRILAFDPQGKRMQLVVTDIPLVPSFPENNARLILLNGQPYQPRGIGMGGAIWDQPLEKILADHEARLKAAGPPKPPLGPNKEQDRLLYKNADGELHHQFNLGTGQNLFVWQPKQGHPQVVHNFSPDFGTAPGGFYREGNEIGGWTGDTIGSITYRLFTRTATGWKQTATSPLGGSGGLWDMKMTGTRTLAVEDSLENSLELVITDLPLDPESGHLLEKLALLNGQPFKPRGLGNGRAIGDQPLEKILADHAARKAATAPPPSHPQPNKQESRVIYQDDTGELRTLYNGGTQFSAIVWYPKEGPSELVHDFSAEPGASPDAFYRQGDEFAGHTGSPEGSLTYHLFTRKNGRWKEVIRSPMGSINAFKYLKWISTRKILAYDQPGKRLDFIVTDIPLTPLFPESKARLILCNGQPYHPRGTEIGAAIWDEPLEKILADEHARQTAAAPPKSSTGPNQQVQKVLYHDDDGELHHLENLHTGLSLLMWQPRGGKRELVRDLSSGYEAPHGPAFHEAHEEGDRIASLTQNAHGGLTYRLFTRDHGLWRETLYTNLGSRIPLQGLQMTGLRKILLPGDPAREWAVTDEPLHPNAEIQTEKRLTLNGQPYQP